MVNIAFLFFPLLICWMAEFLYKGKGGERKEGGKGEGKRRGKEGKRERKMKGEEKERGEKGKGK